MMMISEVVPARYLLLFCFIYPLFYGKADAENVPGNQGGLSDEDTSQFHDKMANERKHLLAHLADRMDLDGEGLRHIQRHFGQQAGDAKQDLRDVANGDNTKGIFYFFKFHDYDDNQKLDGLEWMQALTDFHEEDDNKDEFKEGGKMFLEHEAEAIVDELLSKHDKNDDGMIDFIELMNQNVNSFITELDKPAPEDAGPENNEQQQQNEETRSSLEQEFNKLQQAQQGQNQGQQEDQQQQPHQEQKHDQDNQEKEQQTQEDQQQKENNQQESLSEETQGEQEVNQEQQESEQKNEPSSLEEEYNRQQQEQS